MTGSSSAPTVALVTGASAGIGEATARRLAVEPGMRLVLVARREDRLRALAEELGERTSWLALDVTDPDAPDHVRRHVEDRHGRLDLLVNNAGSAWRARFEDGGSENVRRTMALNFDAVVGLTEALLDLLHRSAPSAIVNVASVAGRVSRPASGSYSASKAALIAWSDALHAEEKARGVHVGLVLPGFIRTEGFPADELIARRVTRWAVSTPERAAEAIVQAGLGRKPEVYVPRPYRLAAVARILTPGLVRRAMAGGAGKAMTTATGATPAAAASTTATGADNPS